MRKALIATILSLLGWGCSSRTPQDYTTMSPEEAFRYIHRLYQKGKYTEAVEGFEFYTLNFSGSSKVDSAQLLLGEAHQKLKEYILAANAFSELVRRFPNSPLVPEAIWREGYCYYLLSPPSHLDQEYTLKAISTLQNFIDAYPQLRSRVLEAQTIIEKCRAKLGEKTYRSAEIYLKLNQLEAAIIYFQEVVDRYYDTDWAPLALIKLAEIYRSRHQDNEAEETLKIFLERYPDSPLADQARVNLQAVSKKSGDGK